MSKRCPCPRRAWVKCTHGWFFNFKPKGGKGVRISLDAHFNRHIDSKIEAEGLAADLRKAIRAGTFGRATPRDSMTLDQLVTTYLDRYVKIERPTTADDFQGGLNVIVNTILPVPTGGDLRFGDWPLSEIVTDSIERYREARRAAGAGVGGSNREPVALAPSFNWAVRVGYVDATPFKRHTETVVRLTRETPRSRRLDADHDEERSARRVRAAPSVDRRCALETGMRRGEILSLQWSQIEG